MESNKTVLNKITKYMIYLYIIIIMMSANTGTAMVKGIRLIITALLVLNILSTKKVIKSSYCLWAIIFLIYNAILIPYAYSKSYAIDYVFSLMYVLIVNILICQFAYKNDIVQTSFKIVILGALLKNILVFGEHGILVFLTSRGTDNTSANLVGLFSAISFSICMIFALNKKKDPKHDYDKKYNINGYLVLAIIFLIFTILSASRKALIYASIPLITYFLANGKNILKKVTTILVILSVLIIGYIILTRVEFFYNLLGHRIESMISGFEGGETDSSTKTRLRLIERGMDWFKDRPWTGYGLSNFKALNENKNNSSYYAHNNYVELLVDCGIIGVVIYYWIYIKIFILAWKNKTNTKAFNPIILGIFISFLIGEYGMVTYYEAFYQLMILLIYIYLNKQRAEKKEDKGAITDA